MNVVCSRFIGNYKLGDNINYNLRTLCVLYATYKASALAERLALRKPIIITIVSIIEALLYDLHYRVVAHTLEGVGNISDEVAEVIRDTNNLDKFNNLIQSAKKHGLIESEPSNIYDQLHSLRKLRNRIHIANENNEKPYNEADAFTEQSMREAERIAELVMRIFERKYLRDDDKHYVTNFELPWEPHYPQLVSNEAVKRRILPLGWEAFFGSR